MSSELGNLLKQVYARNVDPVKGGGGGGHAPIHVGVRPFSPGDSSNTGNNGNATFP